MKFGNAIKFHRKSGYALSKTFPREVRGTADPSATLGMTKGRFV
jgi:hypothetical protein